MKRKYFLIWLVIACITCITFIKVNAQIQFEGTEGGFVSKEATIDKIDDNELNSALNPFSIDKLTEYLKLHPNSKHIGEVKLIIEDEKIVDSLINSTSTNRPIIPISKIENGPIKQAINMNPIKGRMLYDFSNFKVFCNIGGRKSGIFKTDMSISPVPPCGEGSVLIFKGGNAYNYNTAGFIGDENNPLRIVYIEKFGFVYIGGKGKKLDKNGNVQYEFDEEKGDGCSLPATADNTM